MKATDLMLGDWVYSDFRSYPIKVDSLTSETNEINRMIAESFDPIPLTPEILEKNGFFVDRYEEECVADYTFIKKPIYRYDEGTDFAIEFDGWALRITNDFPEREISINPDTSEKLFVHELQHALRLCGIEKEIEL